MNEKPIKKESKLEVTKRASHNLRGAIAETLATNVTHFDKDTGQLLKFHGVYQQDDRDERHKLRQAKQEVAFSFMVRCAIPAGVVTADQYLALDELSDDFGGGSLRITTRQGFQFHGIIKSNLKTTIAGINQSLLTTLSACGDVERNVMACPAPLPDAAHVMLRSLAREAAVQLRPASRAYHEIWLDGEKQSTTQPEEPFYGDQYLPRKFKIGMTIAEDNCIDVYSYDLGLVAVLDGERVEGFDVVVGGGMGMTHGKADTMAVLAQPFAFIEPTHVVETAKTMAAIFRDFGDRGDRRHARLKYLLAERGIDWFRQEFERRALFDIQPWRSIPDPVGHDHLGRNPQGDGRWFLGLFIENGRIRDRDDLKIKTGLRTVIQRFRPGLALTPHQNLLLTDLAETDIDEIERILADHGVNPVAQISSVRRHSMACPALPTCGLALSESERLMPTIVDRFETAIQALGLGDEAITMRMTGCPNGCARPYTADIAFVGRRADVYHIYVGGGLSGNRVADLYAADVPVDDLVGTLQPLLASWAKERRAGEGFGDYYQRVLGRSDRRMTITGAEEPTQPLVQLRITA